MDIALDRFGFDTFDADTDPTERQMRGGCSRCSGYDDCYCDDSRPSRAEMRRDAQHALRARPTYQLEITPVGGETHVWPFYATRVLDALALYRTFRVDAEINPAPVPTVCLRRIMPHTDDHRTILSFTGGGA